MKKLIFLIVMMLTCNIISAQIAGVDFSEAKIAYTDADIEFEKLLRINKEAYVIPYKQTPVGLKHCMEKLNEIMYLNDLNFENIILNEVLIPNYVKSLADYGHLSIALHAGSAEIRYVWKKNEYLIALQLDSNVYNIMFVKIKQ